MSVINKKTFFSAATATGSATMDNINLGSQLVLEFTGTATSFSAVVEGIVGDYNENEWSQLAVIPLKDFDVKNTITSNGIYVVAADAIVHLRVRLTAVSGGSVTVVGKLCN